MILYILIIGLLLIMTTLYLIKEKFNKQVILPIAVGSGVSLAGGLAIRRYILVPLEM